MWLTSSRLRADGLTRLREVEARDLEFLRKSRARRQDVCLVSPAFETRG